MLPLPIFSLENFRDLAIIVEPKMLQKEVAYFCTRPLASQEIGIKFDLSNAKNKRSI